MATFQVTDPNTGQKIKLTGDSPPTEEELEEIFANLNPAKPTEEREDGFIERVNEGLDERREEFGEIIEARASGEQGVLETALQITGKGIIGPIFDVVGEGLVSAFRALPDSIEQPLREEASTLLDSEIGQMGLRALQEGGESYSAFAEENPRAARNIESVVNTALAFMPVGSSVGAGEKTTRTSFVTKIGEAIKAKGVAQNAQKKLDFVQDLILPKQTAKARADQVARTTEEGVLNTKKVQPSIAESKMIDEVSKIEGVASNKSLQANFNVIQQANRAEAEALKKMLAKNDVIFPRKEFKAAIKAVRENLKNNPLIVGDAAKTADKIIKKFDQILLQNKSTGSGLLQARKQLDDFVRSQKGDKAFDPSMENALSIAVREIRQTTNDFLATKAKDVPVKESLAKQSSLFRAMDNIAPKAADEAGNAISRAIQKLESKIPLKGQLASDLALIGLGGSSIAAIITNPALVGTALLGAASLKGAKSAGAKKFVGNLINRIDKAIVNSPQIAAELRVDRAALVELLESLQEENEE